MQWSHCLSKGIQELGNIEVLAEMWRDLQGCPLHVRARKVKIDLTLENGKMDTFKIGLIKS